MINKRGVGGEEARVKLNVIRSGFCGRIEGNERIGLLDRLGANRCGGFAMLYS